MCNFCNVLCTGGDMNLGSMQQLKVDTGTVDTQVAVAVQSLLDSQQAQEAPGNILPEPSVVLRS